MYERLSVTPAPGHFGPHSDATAECDSFAIGRHVTSMYVFLQTDYAPALVNVCVFDVLQLRSPTLAVARLTERHVPELHAQAMLAPSRRPSKFLPKNIAADLHSYLQWLTDDTDDGPAAVKCDYVRTECILSAVAGFSQP